MKAKLKKNILFLISTFALLFASCSDINTGDDGDYKKSELGDGYGSIRISFNENERTAYPILDSGNDKWTWTIKGRPSTSSNDADWEVLKVWEETAMTGLTNSAVGVRSGTWNFILTAEKITSVTVGDNTEKKTVTTYSGIGKGSEENEDIEIADDEASVVVNFKLMLTLAREVFLLK